MAKQPIDLRSRNYADQASAAQGNGLARSEEVGRALGYTDKEQAIARDILNGFVWRRAAQPPEKEANAREENKQTLDDLEAAS